MGSKLCKRKKPGEAKGSRQPARTHSSNASRMSLSVAGSSALFSLMRSANHTFRRMNSLTQGRRPGSRGRDARLHQGPYRETRTHTRSRAVIRGLRTNIVIYTHTHAASVLRSRGGAKKQCAVITGVAMQRLLAQQAKQRRRCNPVAVA